MMCWVGWEEEQEERGGGLVNFPIFIFLVIYDTYYNYTYIYLFFNNSDGVNIAMYVS